MDNRFYKVLSNVFQENSENTPDGPRWVLKNHIVTACLNTGYVILTIMFADDTEILIECHTPMETASIANMIILNNIRKIC